MNKEDLKYLKRAINNAKAMDAIEYEGIIYQADDYLSFYKNKLKKAKLLISVIALGLWFLIIFFFNLESRLFELIILLVMCIVFYLINERMVNVIIPDDSFKHMKKR